MTAHTQPGPATRFAVADRVTATEPPERRGLARDDVRLLVASSDGIRHAHFRDLADQLNPGDLIVVNTSATIAAEVDGQIDSTTVVVHVAAHLDDGDWVVELRSAPAAAAPILDARPGALVELPSGDRIRLRSPYPHPDSSPTGVGNRLWRTEAGAGDLAREMERSGRPIAYGHLSRRWPLADYQTIFARDPGSAEMPSAGRPFSGRVLAALAARGVRIAPITLHTGVSSQEAGEGLQAEPFRVPATTAQLVNATRDRGGRIVAVGTTVTRALESATGPDHRVHPAAGWTTLILGPRHPVRVVDGLITGWHDPQASHLLLVESVAGVGLTQRAYDEAVSARYRWHEFGDSCLLLP